MRRLPTATKRLRGTLRKDRLNVNEPAPPRGAPKASASLPSVVAAQRRNLVKVLTPMNVLTRADGPALELLAFALAEYDASARVVLEQGATYECKTEAGAIMRRARPEQAIAADAWRRAAQMLASFGLTPASRSKVETLPPDASASKWAGLLNDPMERLLHRREGSMAAFQRRRPARPGPGGPA
jgi:P27 family predicted phage terminase small subunit